MSKIISGFEEIKHRITFPREHIYAPYFYDRKSIENSLYAKYGFADEELNAADNPDDPRYDVRKLYRPVKLIKNIPGIPKMNPSSPEYVFWKFWFDRMRNGYFAPDGRFITGYQAFGYNFTQAQLRNEKDPSIFTWMDPLFRDNDHDIATILWNNRMKILGSGKYVSARNHVEAKSRGVGWTVINEIVDHYNFTIGMMFDGIARAYPDEDSLKPERLRFQETWSRLHPIFRSIVRRGKKQYEEMEVLYNNLAGDFAIGFKTGKTMEVVNSCSFDIVSSKDAAGVYKGARKLSIEVIEAGKWKKGVLKALFEKNEKCIGSSGLQWGSFKIGGTSDSIHSNESDYKDMIVNHKKYNATLHLSNAGVCQIGSIDYRTGKSDVVKAITIALKNREDKSYDPERQQAEISENPIFIEEILNPQVSYSYNKVVLTELEKHVTDNGYDKLWVRGKIEDDFDIKTGEKTGELRFVECKGEEEGNWYMNLETPPLPMEHDYFDIAAIDDRNTNWKTGVVRRENDSKNAMIIYRRKIDENIMPGMKTDVPAMIYFADQQSMFSEYEEFIKGIKLYGVKQVVNEKNNIAFWAALKAEGLDSRLMLFDGDVGLKVTSPIIAEMTRLGQRYFAEKRHKSLTSLMIIDSFKIWGSGDNTDIGSAMHLIFYIDNMLSEMKRNPQFSANVFGAKKSKVSIVLGQQRYGESSDSRKIIKLGKRIK